MIQVAEWKLKCEAIEKREAERHEADAKKHKEEVAFLENHGESPATRSDSLLSGVHAQGHIRWFVGCTHKCHPSRMRR